MKLENTEPASSSSEITRGPGELFWSQGSTEARPLLIRQGVVAYRRGHVAIGLLGPGQLVPPVPGVMGGGEAAADLMAVTEAIASEVQPGAREFSEYELAVSARAVAEGADRLGNMSLPQRLAALLLDVTDLTGQPIVGCRQDIIAIVAAARRETVATILSSWRDEDWIQTRYRRCKVLDREALERIRSRGTS